MPHPRFYLRCAIAVLVATTLFAAGFGQVPRPPAPTPFPSSTLVMTVTDENGVVVPYAWVFLQSSPTATPLRCETDFAGHCEFRNLVPGLWQPRVEKPGFYVISGETVQTTSCSIGLATTSILLGSWRLTFRTEALDFLAYTETVMPTRTINSGINLARWGSCQYPLQTLPERSV
jgi:hypothetical protein